MTRINTNTQEMADAAIEFEEIGNALRKRNVTSATVAQALRWCKEDRNQRIVETATINVPFWKAILIKLRILND